MKEKKVKEKDDKDKESISIFEKIWGLICTLFFALVLVAVGDIFGTIVSIIIGHATGLLDKYELFFEYFVTFGSVLAILLFVWFRKEDRHLLKKLKFKPGHFLIGLVIGGTTNIMCAFSAMLNKDLIIAPSKVAIIGLVIAFVLVCIQSTSEELLCRFFIYEKVKEKFKSPLVPIFVNAIFFACMHLGNNGIDAISLIDLLLFGLITSLLVYYEDGFWIAAAYHTSWNFMQNFVLGLPNSGLPAQYSVYTIVSSKNSMFYNTVFGVEGTIFCVILDALVLLAIFLLLRKKKS